MRRSSGQSRYQILTVRYTQDIQANSNGQLYLPNYVQINNAVNDCAQHNPTIATTILQNWDLYKIVSRTNRIWLKDTSNYNDEQKDRAAVIYHVYDPDADGRYITPDQMLKMPRCHYKFMRPYQIYKTCIRPTFNQDNKVAVGIRKVDNPWRDAATFTVSDQTRSRNACQVAIIGSPSQIYTQCITTKIAVKTPRYGQQYLTGDNTDTQILDTQ